MKFTAFKYSQSANLGDDIQTLAVMQHLPQVDRYVDRDFLNEFEGNGAKFIGVMNGFFSNIPANWPPAKDILPIFVGFHLSPEAMREYMSKQGKAYLKSYQPIGCRDGGTAEFLQEQGIVAFTSYCSTLTFPKREKTPRNGRPFIVDGRRLRIPKTIRKQAVYATHVINDSYSAETKLKMAGEMINAYKEEASVVITTRIHCAMPCIAMGIPVVYFGRPGDHREAILTDLGLKIYSTSLHVRRNVTSSFVMNKVDWNGQKIDVSDVAAKIKNRIADGIASYTK